MPDDDPSMVPEIDPSPHLHLEHCEVRCWRESDAESLAHHADNRRVWINLRDTFPHPYALADARAYIRSALEESAPSRFAIVVEGEAVGSIGFLLQTDVERVSAEVGYWIGEDLWGRGITTEALRALTDYAVRRHRLTRMYAVPFDWNDASHRVLKKAGYVLEGRMQQSAIKDGRIIDQLLYAYVVPAELQQRSRLLPPAAQG